MDVQAIISQPFTQFLAFVLLVATLERAGLPVINAFKVLMKINGNFQPQIDELKEHAHVANEEMGEIKESVKELAAGQAKMQSDLSFIRGRMSV